MTKQTILWTVLPNGRFDSGRHAGQLRVSVVVSPRLTPQSAAEQTLGAFAEFVDWPGSLGGLRLGLQVGGDSYDLAAVSQADSTLWKQLLPPETPVAGFQFQDMSAINLRSFPVRNVLGFVRRQYGRIAAQAAAQHPTLLPWKDADPALKGMLEDLGTRTHTYDFGNQQLEVALPGFSRFFEHDGRESPEDYIDEKVFSDKGRYRGQARDVRTKRGGLPRSGGQFVLRALPPDWHDPAQGGADASIMAQFSSADEYSFYQADRFYRRSRPSAAQRAMRRPGFSGVPAAPTEPEYDFHRIVASYADYPMLLRQLGLVIDCAVLDERAIDKMIANAGGTATGAFSLKIKSNGSTHSGADDATPQTAWQADSERFIARPQSGDHERGLLKLQGADDRWQAADKEDDSPFDVYQVDPDGAALKTVGFTLTAQNLVAKSLSPKQADGEVTYTTGDEQAVAGMRTGGIGISRHGRATQVAEDAASAKLKNLAIEGNNSAQVVLFAEDLLRGYRVDVAPVDNGYTPGLWHSLCAREGEYRLVNHGKAVRLPPDEGYIKGASTTQSVDASANPDDHYLHESLFRWTGWSLCTPRPGRTLRAQEDGDSQLQGEASTTVNDVASKGNGIAAQFRVAKGSLPRLRFGQQYRMRARMVDLAGNSLAVDDPTLGDLENATDAVGYWRFEPVDPPPLIHRHRVSEGESLERMVIRSNFDATAQEYLNSTDFSAAIQLAASADFEYPVVNERHVVPPKASQQQCEHHGLFDDYLSSATKIKDGYAIAARESGSLYDDTPGAQLELVTPQSAKNVATTTSLPPHPPSAQNPVGDRFSGGQYLLHREAQVEMPYLPDGAAAGIALFALPGHQLPGVTGEMVLGPSCVVWRAPDQSLVLLVSHAGDWPDVRGCRIVLHERDASYTSLPCDQTDKDDGHPRWDEEERVLTLFAAKGAIVRLAYASFIDEKMLPGFGIPRWAQSQSERQYIVDMAALGRHWMLSPYRMLTLVHATQQPVCLPELIKLSVSRKPGAQHADLHCRMVQLHGPSSGKFEIEADWGEWVDDLQKEGPQRISGHGQLGEIPLAENHANQFVLSNAIKAQQVDPNRPRARGNRHEMGDTKFRLIRYRVRATTRFREYLPPSLAEEPEQLSRLGPVALGEHVKTGAVDDPGAPVLPDPAGSEANTRVLASAPPDDPRVLYVVPTFRWQETEGSSRSLTVTRQGNGLRVWLDRPWFSAGDGELLGVVLFANKASFTEIPASMQPLVTMWGLDPLWETTLPKAQTGASDFRARVHDEAVLLQERPDDAPVHVVGHRVNWDPARKLWYCDIELDAGGSYMPFVRLALVRYQPNALYQAKISKVVLAEFAQVLPRRRADFERTENSVSLSLRGIVPHFGSMKFPVDSEFQDISFVNGPHETGRNRVELVLQTRDPAIDSDLAWEDAVTLASSVVAPAGSGTYDPFPGLDIGRYGVQAAATQSKGRKVQPRAGGSIKLDSSVQLAKGISADIQLAERIPGGSGVNLFDPKIWEASAELPDTGDRPARLMVREFERYYSDRTVPQHKGDALHRRRVVEERLVYSMVFDLAD